MWKDRVFSKASWIGLRCSRSSQWKRNREYESRGVELVRNVPWSAHRHGRKPSVAILPYSSNCQKKVPLNCLNATTKSTIWPVQFWLCRFTCNCEKRAFWSKSWWVLLRFQCETWCYVWSGQRCLWHLLAIEWDRIRVLTPIKRLQSTIQSGLLSPWSRPTRQNFKRTLCLRS